MKALNICQTTAEIQLVKRITRIKSIQIEDDQERLRPIDADLQIPDTSKFTKKTGWKPEIPFNKTMLDLLEYWRKRTLREGQNLVRQNILFFFDLEMT